MHWIINSKSSGGLITLDGRHRWLFQAAQLPPDEGTGDDRYVRLVRDAVGVEDLAVDIRRTFPWLLNARIATTFRHRDLFLVGDAAHRFPPTGGFGMNTQHRVRLRGRRPDPGREPGAAARGTPTDLRTPGGARLPDTTPRIAPRRPADVHTGPLRRLVRAARR
jgi:hypothetical protein